MTKQSKPDKMNSRMRFLGIQPMTQQIAKKNEREYIYIYIYGIQHIPHPSVYLRKITEQHTDLPCGHILPVNNCMKYGFNNKSSTAEENYLHM